MKKHYQTPKIELYEIELQDAVLVASTQQEGSIYLPKLDTGYSIGEF